MAPPRFFRLEPPLLDALTECSLTDLASYFTINLHQLDQLAAISQELLKIFRGSELSSEKLPKIEGLNLPWRLQAAGETFVLSSAQGIKPAKHGIPQ